MQDLNNEMDDLFRKAVELYPLKPCDNKWEEISPKIKSKRYPILFPVLFARNRNIRMSVLVGVALLIPVTIISILPWFNHSAKSRIKLKTPAISNSTVTHSAIKTQHTFPLRIDISTLINQPRTTEAKLYSNRSPLISALDDIRTTTISQPTLHSIEFFDFPTIEAENHSVQVETVNDYQAGMFGINSLHFDELLQNDHQPELPVSGAGQQYLPLQHLSQPRRMGFYLGIVGGPLISQVEHQGLSKPGFDFGILMGYRFNKRFSIETGLLRTRQYLSAEGEDLKSILTRDTVKSLEGNRNAFAIPLTLKYNFVCRTNGNFFITAGVSTVIGVDDHILITVDGRSVPPTNVLDLGIASFLPAYMNFSLGYEYKMGKFANIRIEPYIEIPMKNSAGNSFKTHTNDRYIQVINSGIHIGISRFLN
jgi:hypothetical protein